MSIANFFRRILGYRILFTRSLSETPTVLFAPNTKTRSGAEISEDTALALSTVFCAVMMYSNTVRMLPFALYQSLPGNRKKAAEDHAVYRLLRYQANPRMAASRFWAFMEAQKKTWGNGLAEIERDRTGRPMWLWPIHASRVKPLVGDNGLVTYQIRNEIGIADSSIPQSDMLHFMDYSKDGVWGMSPIQVCRDSLGLTAAAEQFGADFFANGATASGVLQRPKEAPPLKQDDVDKLRAKWMLHHGGEQRHAPAILQEGTEWKQTSIPNEDAQFLQTRVFQVGEVARIYWMSPIKLKEYGRATWGNMDQADIEWLRDSVSPGLVDMQDECDNKLLTSEERRDLYCKFNVRALMWTTHNDRKEYYRTMKQIGVYTTNDILALEDMDDIGPDGDVRLVESNMTTLDRMIKGEAEAESPAAQMPMQPPAEMPPDNMPMEPADELDDDEPAEAGVDPLLPVAIHLCQQWCTREAKALANAAKKANFNFTKWADKFYGEAESVLAENLAAVEQAAAIRGDLRFDRKQFAKQQTRGHRAAASRASHEKAIETYCEALATTIAPEMGNLYLKGNNHEDPDPSVVERPGMGDGADGVAGDRTAVACGAT